MSSERFLNDQIDLAILNVCLLNFLWIQIKFLSGWVFWDDENQDTIDGGNMVAGYTPEGVYELDTLMYFCCNTKGNKSQPIDLPLDKPFYLLAYNSKRCQSVNGAIASIEYIKWDDEDRGNTNAHSAVIPYGVNLDPWDTTMYFCYYDTGRYNSNNFVQNSSAVGVAILSLFTFLYDNKHHQALLFHQAFLFLIFIRSIICFYVNVHFLYSLKTEK